MGISVKLLLSMALTMWLGLNGVQTATAAQFHEECNADITKYCSAVTPGSGRIMACLYAHELAISPACDKATSDISDIFDSIIGMAGDALAICLPDIEKNCSSTKIGSGRMLYCLSRNKSALSEECSGAVAQFKSLILE